MKKVTKIFSLIFLTTALVTGIIFGIAWGLLRKSQNEALEAKSRKSISIDQVFNKWKVEDDNNLHLEVYVTNKYEKTLNARLEFKCELDNKKIDESYIKKMIEIYGENKLYNLIEKSKGSVKLDKQPLLDAIAKYIERGNKLIDSLDYEPTNDTGKNYDLSFYEDIYLLSNENKKIIRDLIIPPIHGGRLLKIEVKNIKSNQRLFLWK